MRKRKLHSLTITMLILLISLYSAGQSFPVTVTDQTASSPLNNPTPSSFQPRYISGFGEDDSFTIFYEDRDNSGTISYIQTTSGPTGFPSSGTATNITETHFCIKDWPINIGGTDYNYRAWGSVGNNADHKFYVSNDLTNWTLVSTFTISNTAGFSGARGWVYYGFHDVILINGTYYAFAESNQSQTMLCRSTNGDDSWEAFASVGGSQAADGPLQTPTGVSFGWTPSGTFFDLGNDNGYGKIYCDPRDSDFYLAINTEAKASLSPSAFETAFTDPDNWTWNDGTTGPAANAIISETAEHDLRECWQVSTTTPDNGWTVIYDADFGSGDGGKALGYLTMSPPVPITEVWVDDDYCETCGNDGHTWGTDAFDNIQDGINGLEDEGTVNVAAGTYSGYLSSNKPITLRGNNCGVSASDPSVTRNAETIYQGLMNGLATDNIVIDGFTLTSNSNNVISCTSVADRSDWQIINNRFVNAGGSLQLSNGLIQITAGDFTNLEFSDNLFEVPSGSPGRVSIYMFGSAGSITLDNANFDDNRFVNVCSPTSFWLNGGSADNVSFSNNVILDANNRAIQLDGFTNVLINNNEIDGLADSYAIKVQNGSGTVSNNILKNIVEIGIEVSGNTTSATITGNTFENVAMNVTDEVTGGIVDLESVLTDNTFDRAVVIRDATTNDIIVNNIYGPIQDAIDDASSGNVVEVAAGTYQENIEIDVEGLTLNAVGDATIQDVDAPEDPLWPTPNGEPSGHRVPVIHISANNVTIDGFKVRDFDIATYVFPVLWVNADGITVQNMDFYTDAAYPDWQQPNEIRVEGNNATIKGNTILRDHDYQKGHPAITLGVAPQYPLTSNSLVGDVLIENNSITGGPIGGDVLDNATVELDNNTIDGAWAEGIWFYPVAETANLIITNNTVQNHDKSGTGSKALKVVSKPATINAETHTNDMLDALIADNPNVPSFLLQWIKNVHNVTQDLFYDDIQAAIDDANTNDVLEVAAGTYNEKVSVNIDNLTINSVEEHGAIIEGDGTANPTLSIEADGVKLDGFHVKLDIDHNGGVFAVKINANNAELDNVLIDKSITWNGNPLNQGAAIDIESGTSGFSFLNSTVNSDWNGIYAPRNPGSTDVTIENVEFNYPGQYGALLMATDDASIEGNTFNSNGSTSNSSYGIILTAAANDIDIIDNSITGTSTDNDYVGILLQKMGSAPTLGTVNISGNTINKWGVGIKAEDFTLETGAAITTVNNRLNGNVIALENHTDNDPFDANCNWWGTYVQADIAGMISGSVTYDNVLMNSTIDPTDPNYNCGTPLGNPIINLNTLETYSEIQTAIDDAAAGHVIEVAPGTYSETVTIDVTGLTLKGPNYGISGNDENRTGEATIEGQVIITADEVTFDGFDVTPPDATTNSESEAIRISNSPDNVIVSNNIVRDFGENGLAQWIGLDGIVAFGGTETDAIENVTIIRNLVKNLDGRDTDGGAAGISIQGNVNGATVENNVSRNIGMESTAWAFGVVVRGTGNHSVTPLNVTVHNNTLEEILSNPSSSTVGVGLGLESGSATFSNNEVSNTEFLFQDKTASLDLATVVSNNTFDRGAYVDALVLTNWYVVFNSIQDAIDAAATDDVINAVSGEYDESLTIITNGLTLQGLGDGVTLNTGSANGISLTADNVTIDNFTTDNDHHDGIELGNSDGTTLINCSFDNNHNGLKVSNAAVVTNLTVENCSFDNNTFGWYISNSSSGGTNTFDGITVENTTFNSNTKKGLYIEKLSNATFDYITVDGSGTADVPWNSGIDINLKWADYENISITNSSITDCGYYGTATHAEAPAAVAIKARDDGSSYGADPATLANVTFIGNTVSGPENGLRFGEFGTTNNGPTNVTVSNNDFSATFANDALTYNVSGSNLDATCNWWGSTDASAIDAKIGGESSGDVTWTPYLQTAEGPCGGDQPVHNTTQDIYYTTIQSAIDDANAGDVIEVSAGTYEETLYVDVAIDLEGPNYNVNPNTGSRSAEAIICYPENMTASDPDSWAPLVYIDVDDMEINGFTINDDNYESSVNYSYFTGIAGYQTSNLIVTNNIVVGFNYTSIFPYQSHPAETPVDGVQITDNLVKDNYGLYHSIYIQGVGGTVSGNTVENCGGAIQIQPYSQPNGGTVANNSTDSYVNGIYYNYAKKGAGKWYIENNDIARSGPPSGSKGSDQMGNILKLSPVWDNDTKDDDVYWSGLYLRTYGTSGTGDAPEAEFNNNNVNGTGSPDPYWTGIRTLWIRTIAGDAISTFTGNTLINADHGVYVHSDADVANVTMRDNNMSSNTMGAANDGTNDLDAYRNWWGDATGPYHDPDNTGGLGSEVSDYVLFDPWWEDAAMTELHEVGITIPALDCDLYTFNGTGVKLQFECNTNTFNQTITIGYNGQNPDGPGDNFGDDLEILDAYWEIESTEGDPGTYSITFDVSDVPGIKNIKHLHLLKRPSGGTPADWVDQGTATEASLENYPELTWEGLNSFSEFALANGDQVDIAVHQTECATFEAVIKPTNDIGAGTEITNLQFTIKWPVTDAPNMTFTPNTAVGMSSNFTTVQSGGYNYATFAAGDLTTTGITGGDSLVVLDFTHDNSGSGTGNFEVMADDDAQAAVNNVFYVEYFGADATGISYANAEDVSMGYCPLTIGGSFTADNKTYDGNTDATFATDNLELETVLGSDDVSLTGYAAQFASKDVAAGIEVSLYDNNGGTSNLSGDDAGKYTLTFAGAPTTTADITAVSLTAVIIGNPTKDYDGTTAATLTSANYSLDGLIGSEEITVTETSGTYDSKDAGSRTVTVTLGAEDFTAVGSTLLSNYDLPTTASGEGTINIIPLLVTADDQEKWYDGAVFTVANYTASYSGFVAGESTADLGGSLSYSGTATTATASGTYTITPAGWTSNNYDISFADGTLEIKALEFSLKAMLQGPYNTGTSFMDNLLRSNNQLPSDQPFNQDPWNYEGTETLPSPTPANAVDWVLVEFRDTDGSGYTVKGRAAGLLRTNGVIEVTVDDTEYPDLHANTDYYMVVWHRNHMPVMSATAETAPVETAFDFTQSGNLFGTDPAVELETGVDGLIAGDVTANGLLQYSGPGNDRGPIIATIMANGGSGISSTLTGGYWFEDVTMNNVLSYLNAGNDRAPILSNLNTLTGNTYLNALYESVVPGAYSSAKNNALNDGPINIRIQSNEIVLIPNDYIDQGAVDNIQFTLAWKTGDAEAEQIVEEFTSAFGLLPQGEVYETDQVSYLVFVSVDLTDLPEEWAPGQPVTAMSFEEVISDHIWIAEDQFTLDNNGMYYVSVWGKDLTGSIATGIQEGSLYRQLNVYPNPVADDHINIQMPSEITGHFTVKVFDAHGKIVCNETKLSGRQAVRLNVSHIENGVYVIQLTGDEIHYQTRFIISR